MILRIFFAIFTIISILFFSAQYISSPKYTEEKITKVSAKNEKQKESKIDKVKVTFEIDESSTDLAKILAGMSIVGENFDTIKNNNFTQKHYKEFAKGWQKVENQRLEKMRLWRNTELSQFDSKPHNIFYPFSGPDFLNAYLCFPEADTLVLVGLEPVGELPKIENLKNQNYLNIYLSNIRRSLSELFNRNYFITSKMQSAFRSNVKGVLPILSIFAVRSNCNILNIQKVFIDKEGKLVYQPLEEKTQAGRIAGVCLELWNPEKDKSQKLYYFKMNLSNGGMAQLPEFTKFAQGISNKINFTKSASYLLHTQNFATIRNLVLNDCKISLQDDTGVPYKFFKQKDYQVQLYGKYARPIRDFSHGFQSDLNQLFNTSKNIKPINFTFGYHFWTDKTSILLFTKE